MWTQSQISSVLTQPISPSAEHTTADLFCHHYGVKGEGNVDPDQVGIITSSEFSLKYKQNCSTQGWWTCSFVVGFTV